MPDIACSKCSVVIVDHDSDSIQCDVCDGWFHATRECSNLKKTMFKLISKQDMWACPICLKAAKDKVDLTEKIKEELTEVRDLNFVLFEENLKLAAKLKECESELGRLKSMPASIHTPRSPELPIVASPELGSDVGLDGVVVSDAKSTNHQPEIRLIGDSHVRNLRPLIVKNLEESPTDLPVKVTAEFYPGAPMHKYVENVICNTNRKPNENVCSVFVGGVNDTSPESRDRLSTLLESNAKSMGRVVIVETPYRYDNIKLNQSISEQNDKLRTLCKTFGWVFVPINFALYRMHYTRIGLHLNSRGKALVCKLITNYLCETKRLGQRRVMHSKN